MYKRQVQSQVRESNGFVAVADPEESQVTGKIATVANPVGDPHYKKVGNMAVKSIQTPKPKPSAAASSGAAQSGGSAMPTATTGPPIGSAMQTDGVPAGPAMLASREHFQYGPFKGEREHH